VRNIIVATREPLRKEQKDMVQIKQKLITVDSYTDLYKTYDIYEGVDDLLHCSCPSSIYQNRVCKHLEEFFTSTQYFQWEKERDGEQDKTFEFVFNSDGYLRVQLQEVFTEAMLTTDEVRIMIEKIEQVLPFMKFFVGMN